MEVEIEIAFSSDTLSTLCSVIDFGDGTDSIMLYRNVNISSCETYLLLTSYTKEEISAQQYNLTVAHQYRLDQWHIQKQILFWRVEL